MRIEFDWYMRQIQLVIVAISQMVLGKGSIEYLSAEGDAISHTDTLHRTVLDLVKKQEIRDAQALMFEHLDVSDSNHLVLALDFYQELNQLTDDELESGGFSRDEIFKGLHKVMDLFSIVIPGM